MSTSHTTLGGNTLTHWKTGCTEVQVWPENGWLCVTFATPRAEFVRLCCRVDGSECLPSSPDTAPAGAAGLEGSAGTLSLYMILFLHRKFPRAVCVQEETICSTAARHVSA